MLKEMILKIKKQSNGNYTAIGLCVVIAVLICFFVFRNDDVSSRAELDEIARLTNATASDAKSETQKVSKTSDLTLSDGWKKNVMKGWQRDEAATDVLGNTKYNKGDITAVEFCDSLDKQGDDAWDVSESKNKSVMAWVVGKKLYIGGNGGVNGKASTKALFYNYTNLREINFETAFHTDAAKDMSSMFENCRKLESLDLSMFDTQNVVDMTAMFRDCRTITGLNLSNFDTSKVMSMNEMFKTCSSLKRLDISGFSLSDATAVKDMFAECTYLSDLVVKEQRIKDEYSKMKLPLLFKKEQEK